jgi:hypothetical protein
LLLKAVLSPFFSRFLACFAGNTNCIVRAEAGAKKAGFKTQQLPFATQESTMAPP